MFALPFGAVSLATLALFFLFDQSLDSVHTAARFTEVWLDSLRNTALQIDRCLGIGGVECNQIEERLKFPLAYTRAARERDKPNPDDRVILEALEEMGNYWSPFRFRLRWFERVSRIAGLGVQDPRDRRASTLQHWLDLAGRAKAARAKQQPDADEIASLKRELSGYVARSESGRVAFQKLATQAVGRLRRLLYVVVIGCVIVMFAAASWISQRLFRAWEAKETRFRERNQELSEALKQRVEELQTALSEKGILLREVQHRVKNNLQLISSLTSLQSRQVESASAVEALRTLQQRVKSMALIHEGLCFSETLAEIDFSKYADQLARSLIQSYAARPEAIRLHLDVSAVLRLDEATPCGLIINELLSNSLKYAFPDSRGGEIRISAHEQDGEVTMEVRDNGVGMPVAFSVERTESLGLLIVTDLAAQLHGEFTWRNEGGAAFRVRFRRRADRALVSESRSDKEPA